MVVGLIIIVIIDWSTYHAVVNFKVIMKCAVVVFTLYDAAIDCFVEIVLGSDYVRLILLVVL